MPSTYTFTAGQILTAADLNAKFAQTAVDAANSSVANTGTLAEARLPYRMNQNVRTTDSVQFVDGVFTGNLTISGTTTYVNTSVLDIKDKNITLAKGSANSSAANGAGFNIEGASVNFTYDDSSNMMILDHLLSIGNSTVNAVFGYNASQLSGGQFIGNVNNYFQVIATNANNGTSASGDYVVADDQGVGSNSYVDMGINSTQWSNTQWTINGPSDSYLYSHGGALAIGTAENYHTNFFANGTLANNEAMRIDSGANVNIGNTKAGATSLTIGNTTVNTVINSSSFNINTVFTANSTVVNAVSYRVNTQFIANSTGVYSTGTVNANAFMTTTVTVNTLAIAVGSNVTINTTSYKVGNSTVYANVVAGELTLSSNSTNSALINSTSFTGTANNASYLANVAAAVYVQNTDSRTLSGNLAFSGANVYYSSGLFVGTKLVVNTSTFFVGNSTVNTITTEGQISLSGQTINSTAYTGLSYTANNSSYLGGIAAANYVANTGSGLIANSTGTFINPNTGIVANSTGVFVNSSYIATISSNNASYLGGVAAASYVNTTGAYTISGVHTHSANMVFSNGNVIIANGGFGTNTQVLISNGTSMYWGTFSANDAVSLGGVNAAAYVVNTDSRTLSGNLVLSGANVTVTGNMRFANGSQLIANNGFGTAGQVLVSNGTSMYWGAGGITVYYANGTQAYP